MDSSSDPTLKLSRTPTDEPAAGGPQNPLDTPLPKLDTGWVPPKPEHLAALLPQYEIQGFVGRGAMGAVYKGRQPGLDREVAVKLLPAEIAADAAFVARFQREGRTLARMQHPGIVAVFECGQTSEGHLYLVMEFVDGTNLYQIIHGPGLDPAQTMDIVIQLCEALQYAHGRGVLHRDIKPANVILTRDGRAKLADFGLARHQVDESTCLTHTNVVMGTPDYIAPEQLTGTADHRADLYSLGVMLYEMLTGHVPRGRFEMPSEHIQGLDHRLDDVVDKAMQANPARRYSSAQEIKQAIHEIQTTPLPQDKEADKIQTTPQLLDNENGESAVATPDLQSSQENKKWWKPIKSEFPPIDTVEAAIQTSNKRDSLTAPFWKKPTTRKWVRLFVLIAIFAASIFAWFPMPKLFAISRTYATDLIDQVLMRLPELEVSESSLTIQEGQEPRAVTITVKHGELDVQRAEEHVPKRLYISDPERENGETVYTLAGAPDAGELGKFEVDLVAIRGSRKSEAKTLTITVEEKPMEWQLPEPPTFTFRKGEPAKGYVKVVTGAVKVMALWSPALTGFEISRDTSNPKSWSIVGAPSQAGTFLLMLEAESKAGKTEKNLVHVTVLEPRAEMKGDAFSTSRGFNMKFVKGEGYWISVTTVNTGPANDVKKLCDDLTKECKGKEIPANYYFTTGSGPLGTHLVAVPR